MAHNELLHSKIRECVGITLESNEELYLVVRKHWIILAETFVTIMGMIMVSIQYIFVHWVNNELDLLIITNRRIIAYDQVKFLDRKMSQTTIDLVQEVNASTSGLL